MPPRRRLHSVARDFSRRSGRAFLIAERSSVVMGVVAPAEAVDMWLLMTDLGAADDVISVVDEGDTV